MPKFVIFVGVIALLIVFIGILACFIGWAALHGDRYALALVRGQFRIRWEWTDQPDLPEVRALPVEIGRRPVRGPDGRVEWAERSAPRQSPFAQRQRRQAVSGAFVAPDRSQHLAPPTIRPGHPNSPEPLPAPSPRVGSRVSVDELRFGQEIESTHDAPTVFASYEPQGREAG